MSKVVRRLKSIAKALVVYGLVGQIAVPAYAACDVSGYWSLEAVGIPLPSNPFVKFETMDDGTFNMVLNACIQFPGTAVAERMWIVGEIKLSSAPPPNEIRAIWELTDDCKWANGWIYAMQPGNYGYPPIKSSLRKLNDKSEAELPEDKRDNNKCPDDDFPNLVPSQ